jgi:hypothetical protein
VELENAKAWVGLQDATGMTKGKAWTMTTHKRNIRGTMNFTAIHSEGSLISTEVLDEIAAGRADGQACQDFGFKDQIAFERDVSSAWLTILSGWKDFQLGLHGSVPSHPEDFGPQDIWVDRILQSLGFEGRAELYTDPSMGQSCPVSHWSGGGEQIIPLHVVGPHQSLDGVSKRGGCSPSPHRVLQGYLNRTEHHWGIVTNGLQIRILQKSPRITTDSYLEFDLKEIIEADRVPEFEVLYRMAHRTRWPLSTEESTPCWLEKFHEKTIYECPVSSRRVAGQICDAIRVFWHGFRTHPDFGTVWQGTNVHLLDRDGVLYRQLLSMIYRLIFLMVCEERDLSKSGSGNTVFAQLYYACYGISRLREIAEQPTDHSDTNCDLWEGVKQTFRLFGDPQLGARMGIQPNYTDLFGPDELSVLDGCKLFNRDFLKGFRCLSSLLDAQVPARIRCSRLDILTLGSFYEFGLDFNPTFPYRDRWSPGARDAPSSLVEEALKQSLEPVISKLLAEANTPAEKETALLGIRVCDPAAKAGRFLVAAARRLGREVAGIRTGSDQPTEEQLRSAVRDVIRDCIYGIDVDPIAVEFSRFALWIDSCDPGRAIAPLHDRIKIGNGLIGLDFLGRLEQGVPNASFDPVSGDDKKTASRAKTRNRQALKQLKRESKTLSSLLDCLGETIRSSQEPAARKALQRVASAADIWTHSFFCQLLGGDNPIIPTNDKLAACLDQEKEPDQTLMEDVLKSAVVHRFFHWPLNFPAIRHPGEFDVVLGNPPWDAIELSQEEFRTRYLRILGSAVPAETTENTSRINQVIERAFAWAVHRQEGFRKFVRASGRFPFAGKGVLNTYALFVELSIRILKPDGRVCLLVPSGIATEHSTKSLFLFLMGTKTLASITGFDNEQLIFPALDHSRRFCLLSLTGEECPVEQADFAFFCRNLKQALDQERHFTLSLVDLDLFNPNTHTAPMFMTRSDADLTKKIYTGTGVLKNDSTGDNPWGLCFLSSFHMSNDKSLIRTKSDRKLSPLYEGKMIGQYDHRQASFRDIDPERSGNRSPTRTNPVQKANQAFKVLPRYWVPTAEVQARCKKWKRPWILGIRSKRKYDAERTVLASILPRAGIANSIHGLGFDESISARLVACLLANLNSLVFDYVARQKVGGADVSIFMLEQLPVLAPDNYCDEDLEYVVPRVVELTYTSTESKPFARECSYKGPPFEWDDQRRAVLRAELDAFFARHYGFDRNDLRYILDPKELRGPDHPGETFRVLKQREIKLLGEFRTQRLVLEAWDRLFRKGSHR